MNTSESIRETSEYILIVALTFAVLQALLIVMHELTHSTMAWVLGYKQSPFHIIWGNPLTMTGWDEAVHYSQLFASGHSTAAAVIGGSPLVVHAAIVTLGLSLLRRKGMWERKWLSHTLFWFVIANLMELIAYITMRAFSTHGDVGIFNRGLGLSPWVLFIAGSLAIAATLFVLFGKMLPRMHVVFARGNLMNEWSILLMTAFFLFLWGSGIRVVLYVYPDPQWMFGLLGFAAFCVVLVVCNPARAWVARRVTSAIG